MHAIESVGPAAIVTLFIASVLPELAAGTSEFHLLLIGCTGTVLAFGVKSNVVLATMVGTVAYGVAFAVLGG